VNASVNLNTATVDIDVYHDTQVYFFKTNFNKHPI